MKPNRLVQTAFIGVEIALLLLLALFIPLKVIAIVGDPNATVPTLVTIQNTAPVVVNISIEGGGPIALVANTTKMISCGVIVEDFDGEGDLQKVNATFYDSAVSSAFDTDDNNYHYSNASCDLNLSFGSFNGINDSAFRAFANCTFDLHYYANPGTWVCNATAYDQSNVSGRNHGVVTVSELLALGAPDTIDYGLINATTVSNENFTNITNLGNTVLNLSIEGYGFQQGDGNAMNCTLGSNGNISIEHEKYNLTASNTSSITLSEASTQYTNLTTTPTVRFFNLTARTNDAVNDIWKEAYWRIYVPPSVAGNCTGNIIIGATTASE